MKRQQVPRKRIDAVVNLAGESINSGRWTKKRKEALLNSRTETTRILVKAMNNMNPKPSAYINASAIGYYGTSQTETFTEKSQRVGGDFLSRVALAWEKEAQEAEKAGIRTVYARLAMTLGNEGALPLIVLPYIWFVGGSIGRGDQWISWVHIEDAVRAIDFAIQNSSLRGPLNVSAPEPLPMDEFGRKIARTLSRPHWLAQPGFLFRLALGERSQLVLQGQKVLPEKLLKHGFRFHYPDAEKALQNLLRKQQK